MMHMTFYWGKEVTLLLDSWRTTTWTGYLLTLLACVVVSAFYQYLEDRRVRFKIASTKKPQEQIEEPLLRGKVLGGGGKWLSKIGGAALFGVNSAIGYMLMLAVMSFNGGVFVAVVVGLAVGYLLFRSGDEDVATLIVDNPCACA